MAKTAMANRRLFAVVLTPPQGEVVNAFVLAISPQDAEEKARKIPGVEIASLTVNDCGERDVLLVHVDVVKSDERHVHIDLRFETMKA